jgi:uncharacterized Zn-finger protein
MAVESRQQSHQLNGIAYDPLRYPMPQFTNPWVGNSSAAPTSQLYAPSSQPSGSALESSSQVQQRPTSISLPFNNLPLTSTSLPGSSLPGGSYASGSSLQTSQDLLNGRTYASQYPVSASSNSYATAPSAGYQMAGYAYQQDAKRPSHPSVHSNHLQLQRQDSMIDSVDSMNAPQPHRNSFSEALDASRGMISLSQSDITPTPRNMYGNQSNRSSPDSYGFPATHSAHSSISSASTFQSYYGSVGDSSLTDYSSASESVDMNHRTLPRPSTLVGNGMPPAPQSMMGQFSSKVSSSSQKKHKCKICDKRFTRPSSLQTHMYSHTGEKPFACEVDGCGRHFSVVSNLRRHRKVHKNDGETPSQCSQDEE